MAENTPFQIAFAVLFFSSLFIAGSYRRRAEPIGGRVSPRAAFAQEGPLIYLLLRVLGPLLWLGGIAYAIYPPILARAALPLPAWLRWCGVGAAAVVPFLILWAQRHLGGNVTRTVVTKGEHSLVTTGPYRWIRHPLYTSGIIFFAALSLVAATWFFAALMAVLAVPLIIRTRREEAMLVERFGDAYRAYMQRTGRFFPRLTG